MPNSPVGTTTLSEGIDQVINLAMGIKEERDLMGETLRELRAWMRLKLMYGPIKHQEPDTVYPLNQHPSGYSAVLVPDWEMKQKLALVEEVLSCGAP